MRRDNHFNAVAVLPQGLEQEGCRELEGLGAHQVQPRKRAATFQADMACLYRLHLQARLPFRLLREMSCFSCQGREELYEGIRGAINWEEWLHPSMSFRVDVTGIAPGLNHTHFTALTVKNALVDLQQQLWGNRSSINLENPDLALHLHLSRNQAVLSLDGSGVSLHRRGYRAAMGAAPLKENLAAGLIRLTGWDGNAPLVDPCCGSGVLLIEAVLMALQQAPGLDRGFALEGWADFQPDLWQQEQERARQRRKRNLELPPVIGFEEDPAIAEQARTNVEAAGLHHLISIRTGSFTDQPLPEGPGVLVCNPPYGQRIGEEMELEALYRELGTYAKAKAAGWQLWLLSGNRNLTGALRLKAERRIPVSNGGIDCRWLHYKLLVKSTKANADL